MASPRQALRKLKREAASTCTIIAVGRELLLGRTLDTNSHWLAGQLTQLGGVVERLCIVDDHAEPIVAELRSAWRRRPAVVITTGGLGPTYDDGTLAAIAKASHRPLQLEPDALEHVRRRYRRLREQGILKSSRLTPAHKKMAILPRGSRLLANPVGAAPGIHLTIRGSHLFALPGVPAEMRGMFEDSVLPLLAPLFGGQSYAAEVIHSGCNDETVLGRVLGALHRRYPGVHFKSDATGFEAGGSLRVHLTARGDDAARVHRQVSVARAALLRALQRAGFAAQP